LDQFWGYSNVIAGVVGNEVMDNLKAWRAAPCVKAYLDDLARYGNFISMQRDHSGSGSKRLSLPLVYAVQHDSPSAEQLPDEAIKLTFDYLSCKSTADDTGTTKFLDNNVLFGINIESWCSSLQTFEYEENGIDESSYHSLWRTLFKGIKVETTMDAVTGEITTQEKPTISPKPLAVPIIFSEIGCSKYLFNRDNGLQMPSLARDWNQISVVLGQPMSEDMSGFIAYGYDGGGNAAFRMMGGDNARWDGVEPLPPSEDYVNFCDELKKVTSVDDASATLDDDSIKDTSDYAPCEEISTKLEKLWGVDLHPISKMPSYFAERNSQQYQNIEAADMLLLPAIKVKVAFLNCQIFIACSCTLAILIALAIASKRSKVEDKQTRRVDIPDYGSCKQ
jgi:hypothetical protein